MNVNGGVTLLQLFELLVLIFYDKSKHVALFFALKTVTKC